MRFVPNHVAPIVLLYDVMESACSKKYIKNLFHSTNACRPSRPLQAFFVFLTSLDQIMMRFKYFFEVLFIVMVKSVPRFSWHLACWSLYFWILAIIIRLFLKAINSSYECKLSYLHHHHCIYHHYVSSLRHQLHFHHHVSRLAPHPRYHLFLQHEISLWKKTLLAVSIALLSIWTVLMFVSSKIIFSIKNLSTVLSVYAYV